MKIKMKLKKQESGVRGRIQIVAGKEGSNYTEEN